MKPTPRPQKSAPWTQADHEDNARRIQRGEDQETWAYLSRKVGLRRGELRALFSRLIDERVTDAFEKQQVISLANLKAADAPSGLRSALFDFLIDDIMDLVQLLTRKEPQHDARAKKTRGRSESKG